MTRRNRTGFSLLAHFFLGLLAGLVFCWAGFLALIVVVLCRPRDPAPEILLAAWAAGALFTLASGTVAGRRRDGAALPFGVCLVVAPAAPVLVAVLAVRAGWSGLRRRLTR